MKLLKSNSNLFPSIFSDLFEIDNLFGSFPMWDKETWLPATNIKEDEKSYEIEMAVPGMKKEDITAKVENGLLTISGENKEEKKENKSAYLRLEYKSDSFIRSFALPENANEESIVISYEDGILKLKVDKKPFDLKKGKKTITIN